MSESPAVHVIVLHWGDPGVTAACLESLRSVTYRPLQAIVIDNGTPDRSGGALAKDFPEFMHLRHDENLGFSDGNNAGLRRALDTGAAYVLLLNNDTQVEPGFLEPMVAAAEADPRVGMVNPKILFADPPGVIWFSRGAHSLWTGIPRPVDRHRADRRDDDGTIAMTFATGCALLLRATMLREIGLLDGALFMYAEDLDLSIRARQAGWKIVNVRKSRVIHHEAVQRKKTTADPFRLRLTARNTLRVNWRHANALQRLVFPLWFGMRWLGYLSVKNLVLGSPGDVAAIWAGVWDALRRRTGPPPRARSEAIDPSTSASHAGPS